MTTALSAPRAQLRISGVTLAADVEQRVLSVQYDNDLDVADMLTVVLDNSDGAFTDSPLVDLGKTVELHLGYRDQLEPMMLGEIASIEPTFPQSGAPTLSVTAYDRSHRLRHDVPDRPAFRFMTDTAIAAQIAVEAGLVPVVDPSLYGPHDELKWTGTDMALLKERARANGFEVHVWWDRLHFRLPRPDTEAHVLEWGSTLSSFSPRLSQAGQAGVQVVRGYDQRLAQTIVAVVGSTALDLDALGERLGSAAVDALATLGRRVVADPNVTSPVEAAVLARALLQEVLDGMYEASGSCVGTPALRAGRTVLVRGVGRRFSGTYRLTRVTHTLDGSGYQTSFEVTQRAGGALLSLLRRSLTESPSPDRAEPVQGVVIGRVVSVDPTACTAQVNLPDHDDDDTVTAVCTGFLAGAGRGAFFLPAAGDQVLVAFEHGALGRAFVIAGLWDEVGGSPVPDAPATNTVRRLRTAAGHSVTFDDTAGQERITVQDKAGSTVVLHPDGTVSLTARKDLELAAPDGEIRMSARDVRVVLGAGGTMDVSRSGP